MDFDVKRKKVLIMGLGLHGGGVASAEFFVRRGARVTVTDVRSRRDLAPSLRALARFKNIRYVLGRHDEKDFLAADLIIKNSGVRRDNPFLRKAIARGVHATSDVGIFFQTCPARIIGITGTRGKSTTTHLVWKMLSSKYPRVHYGGNIRRSVLGVLPKIKKDDLVVLELSSFQLQDVAIGRKSPRVAVFTNLMRDHLNWHRDMREYREAKSVIFRYQRKDDVLFIPAGDKDLRALARSAPGRVREAVLPRVLIPIVDQNLGEHYRSSVALAYAVAQYFKVSDRAITQVIREFTGLESRQEIISSTGGVHFVNDTTATIPDAAIAAIRRFRVLADRHQRRLILIAGGQDKKLKFADFAREIRKSTDTVVLLPGTGTDVLIPHLKNTRVPVQSARNMQEAVKRAYALASSGDYVVLSPGCASFGLFLNEFDRGAQFVKAVQKLKAKHAKR
ncbi:MAG: UDP-N-acetylmuramoylalanine--D-glutamate ligase [Candidatus Sungbacteria bacterium RIFCSPHIGHO2_01_FULL_54_26]|nr:MAG: UDP-N-acetylmuramoylalanine--D-glutamate ligase [Candidatus Sungbacteria bacterium RIFCSPHIGHO2_01_FULL_54_26]